MMLSIVPHRSSLVALALLLGLAAVPSPAALDQEAATGRIVAIADIHGSLDGLTAILRETRLLDDGGRWSGGATHLVQTGDFLDRGRDVRAVMDLLMRLETEARRARGRVDVLFGNHEGMNILRDRRDISPEAYTAFADRRSEDRRRRAFEQHEAAAWRGGQTLDRQAWMQTHPPGLVEYVEALGPNGRYGRWLRSRRVVLRAADTLFMHAGLSPDDPVSIDEVNRGVEQEIRTWDTVVGVLERQQLAAPTFTVTEIVRAVQEEIGRIVEAQQTGTLLPDYVTREFVTALQHISTIDTWALVAADGPLWYRGLATLPDESLPAIESLLARHGARRFVTGHTPQLPGKVTARFGGRVLLADTGMLAGHYKGGRPSAVEIVGGRVTAIYPGAREPLRSPPDAATAGRTDGVAESVLGRAP